MKRKRFFKENGPRNVSLVMTVSLFLILLTFFILLNSIAVRDEKRVREALGSLTGAFGAITGGFSPFKGGENLAFEDESSILEKEFNLEDIFKKDKKILGKLIKIEKFPKYRKINLQDKTLFDQRFKLTEQGREILKKIGKIAKEKNLDIEIIGYTDSTPGFLKKMVQEMSV